MAKQVTKDFSIVGSSFKQGGQLVDSLKPGEVLFLVREPTNQYDKNAVLVIKKLPPTPDGQKRHATLGYVPRGMAVLIAPLMDAGVNVIARKAPNKLYGVCQVAYIPPDNAPPAPPEKTTRGAERTKEIPDGQESSADEAAPTE
jgi:hypothetical protein